MTSSSTPLNDLLNLMQASPECVLNAAGQEGMQDARAKTLPKGGLLAVGGPKGSGIYVVEGKTYRPCMGATFEVFKAHVGECLVVQVTMATLESLKSFVAGRIRGAAEVHWADDAERWLRERLVIGVLRASPSTVAILVRDALGPTLCELRARNAAKTAQANELYYDAPTGREAPLAESGVWTDGEATFIPDEERLCPRARGLDCLSPPLSPLIGTSTSSSTSSSPTATTTTTSTAASAASTAASADVERSVEPDRKARRTDGGRAEAAAAVAVVVVDDVKFVQTALLVDAALEALVKDAKVQGDNHYVALRITAPQDPTSASVRDRILRLVQCAPDKLKTAFWSTPAPPSSSSITSTLVHAFMATFPTKFEDLPAAVQECTHGIAVDPYEPPQELLDLPRTGVLTYDEIQVLMHATADLPEAARNALWRLAA